MSTVYFYSCAKKNNNTSWSSVVEKLYIYYYLQELTTISIEKVQKPHVYTPLQTGCVPVHFLSAPQRRVSSPIKVYPYLHS